MRDVAPVLVCFPVHVFDCLWADGHEYFHFLFDFTILITLLYSLNSDKIPPQSDEESEDTDFTTSEFLLHTYFTKCSNTRSLVTVMKLSIV